MLFTYRAALGACFRARTFSCFDSCSGSTAPTGAVMTFPSTVKALSRFQSARDRKRQEGTRQDIRTRALPTTPRLRCAAIGCQQWAPDLTLFILRKEILQGGAIKQ